MARFAIVPVEATEGMYEAYAPDFQEISRAVAKACYPAMIAAHPPYEITDKQVEAGARAMCPERWKCECENGCEAPPDFLEKSGMMVEARAVLSQFVDSLGGE